MDYSKNSIEDFAKLLASKQSTPGGGGAAALVGALSVALGSMVGEFTLGKEKYAAVQEEIQVLLKEAEELRLRFLKLIDEDAKAFEPLAKAYAIPKDDPGRDEILEEATMEAIRAPLAMMELCEKTIHILRQMQQKGSVLLVSDAGCGAALCKAAIQAAAMNVYINTRTLKNRKEAERIHHLVTSYLDKACPLADVICAEVTKQLQTK